MSSAIAIVESRAAANEQTEYVCWSRMQSEAGQKLQAIVARKEVERQAGNGLFLWGVGNPPALAVNALARMGEKVPVVFSIMKSRPKLIDAAPTRTFAWRRYFDAHGAERELPENVVVTSRADSAQGAKRAHYALMCFSSVRLQIAHGTSFDVSAYRNVGGTGAPVGASQVTALLRRVAKPREIADYEANLLAQLTNGYWVRLADPIEVPAPLIARLAEAGGLETSKWLSLARELRGETARQLRCDDDLFT